MAEDKRPEPRETEPKEPPGHSDVDPRLLELLVCPLTKQSLDYDPVHHELISRAASLAFPIRDGVPLMTIEAARQIERKSDK